MSKNELGNSVIDGLKEGKIEHMFHENLMTSAVKVTIIIPIYNSECYLDECLKSVLQQNFNNYEVICIDDGSEDNSREIVKKYAERYEFIKIIFHEKNRGLSAARNTGLKNACGKYVLFLDADDMIVPETLEELYQCAEQYNLDNIYFNMKKIYETEMQHMQSVDNPEYRHYDGVYSGQEMFCRFAEEKKMKIEACRQFFKRDFLTENSLTFYEGILHEDCLFSFLCAMKAQKVKNINKAPWDMKNVLQKIEKTGNKNILLCERGTAFGYNTLVVDMTGINEMKKYGYPVVMDATHSVQKPGGDGTSTGGNRDYIEPLAKAAIAAGADALFFEVHPEPERALSDGPNMVRLDEIEGILKRVIKVYEAVH